MELIDLKDLQKIPILSFKSVCDAWLGNNWFLENFIKQFCGT